MASWVNRKKWIWSDNLHMFSRWKNYFYIPTIKKDFKRIRYCVYCSQISTGFIKKKTLTNSLPLLLQFSVEIMNCLVERNVPSRIILSLSTTSETNRKRIFSKWVLTGFAFSRNLASEKNWKDLIFSNTSWFCWSISTFIREKLKCFNWWKH